MLPPSSARIAASADPVSQTVRVFGGFEPGVTGIVSGMSGTVQFAAGM